MLDNPINLAASEWLARLDSGDVTAEERAAFDTWRSADPRHAAAYARLSAVWHQLDRARALRPSAAQGVDADFVSALSMTPEAPRSEIEPRGAPTRAVSMRRVALAAAAVLLAITVGWLTSSRFGATVYATSKGGFQRIVLEDHSVVELNTDTRMQVRFGTVLREIDLIRGEASFEVAHDSARPFIVTAGGTAVRAVGTKFNVRRLEQAVEVVVNEGKVLVGAPDMVERQDAAVSLPIITAGHAVISGAGGLQVREISRETAARKLAWQERMLMFEGEPLAQVIAEFNRYNERQLVIVDASLAELRIGGYFRPTNLDAFVSVLERSFGVRCVTGDSGRVTLASAATESMKEN